MSLHVLADHMASKGRNGDSMLVHMTPGEVAGLHALALKHGGELTINPDTGLPEANFLKKLLPMAAGFLLGPAGFGIAESALGAAAMVGGVTGVASGSLEKGLMAGLGAYGGFGLGEALAGAGANALTTAGVANYADTLAAQGLEQGTAAYGEAASKLALEAQKEALAKPFMERAAAGLTSATESPAALGAFAKDNLKYLGAAASPILADMMVPTTTKMPTDTTPAYIRQKLYDPYTQTYKSLAPVKATDWGSRNFSDAYTNPRTGGMATGGIVALAAGGAGTEAVDAVDTAAQAAKPQTVADLYSSIGRTPDAEGLAFWQNAFGTGPVTADQAASFMQSANAVKAQEAAAAAAPPTTVVAPPTTTTASAPAGITALQTQATTPAPSVSAPPTQMSTLDAQLDAQTAVNNIYRNVLGRDADAVGLNFWSNAIAGGRSVDSVYQDILKSANEIKSSGTLGDFDIKNMSSVDAAKPYIGYTSTAGDTVADDWVRNVLGREATADERAQSWYKNASNLKTTADAAQAYADFTNYAAKQTGKRTDLDWMAASQLKELPTKSTTGGGGGGGGDTTVVTKPTTYAPPGTKNPYGNEFNPGDLTYNPDGTITVTPNIPGRPYGGFTGMDQVKNAYTRGGGSLGYTSPVVKTAAEHEERYNRLTGDSQAAYKYLMGKGANPVQSVAADSATGIMRPYWTAGMKYKPKFLTGSSGGSGSGAPPQTVESLYASIGRTPDAEGLKFWQNAFGTGPVTADQAASFYQSARDVFAKEGGKTILVKNANNITEAATLGGDGKYRTASGTTYDADGNIIAAGGGMMGYSVGGGLGTLGGYSDGGRLLKGPGDGVSDSIPATIGAKQQPARLADGEFVVPARIVSELGNGSTDAGAKKLYAMMDRVQKARGKTTGKNKVAANSRADKYLPA